MNKNMMVIGVIVVLLLLGVFFMQSQTKNATSPGVTTDSEKMEIDDDDSISEIEEDDDDEDDDDDERDAKSALSVEIKDFAFSPKTLKVKVGTKVTFTNQDSVGHTATADDGSFDTGLLAKGQSGTVTFDKPGTFAYHCTPHPKMQATITVEN